jgi:eukaryotic-like serine/threonine-protein kinase
VAVKAALPVTDEPVTSHQTLVVPRRAPGLPPAERSRGSRRAWWWWSALLALALFALGGGYYLGSYRYTHAPSVLTKTLPQATQLVEDAGLKVERGPDRFSETVAKGLVVAQEPGPNGRVRKSGTVTVFLSKGPDRRTVPPVAGKDQKAARAALEAVGLTVAAKVRLSYSQTVAKDRVVTTDPKPGERLRPGSSVVLVVSKGKEPVEVPNVTGKQRQEAEQQLRALGFEVDVDEVFSDDVAAGVVIDQTPSSGTADKGSTVRLTVSKGPDLVVVPDVRGQSFEQARDALEALGLKVRKRSFPGGPGRVLRTDPDRGQKVRRGTTVTVYVF